MNNFDEIIYDKTKLFYFYYCQIRVLFRRIFTKFILYILTQLGSIDKLNYCNIVITNLKEEKESFVESSDNGNEHKQFLMLATQIINCNYAGDPSSLQSFINSVELLEKISDSQEEILRLFLLSKLEGRASDAAAENQNTIREIKDSLKKNIRYDQSNLIAAKIQALPYEKLHLLQFIDQCKALALDYRRSLINEGFTQALANKETISKCLEICIIKTRSNIVKLILRAASFKNIQDLLSKFLSSEIGEKGNSNHSINFNSYPNSKNNQNYNNFKKYHFNNYQLKHLGKRKYSNVYSLNENNFPYSNQHYKRYSTISKNNGNNIRNLNDNYYFNRHNNYDSKKLFSNKANRYNSKRGLLRDFNTKNSINHRIYREYNINQTNEQRKQEPYFHESKNLVTPTIKATKTSPFYNKHNNSSITLQSGTNDVIKASDINMIETNFTCSSSSYKSIDCSQQRKNNPYFKTNISKNTMEQVPFCQGNNMKKNTDYKGSSSHVNSYIPSHDTKISYDRSSLTNSERENTSNFNKPDRQNYYRTPFHRNFPNHSAYSDKLKARCISKAKIEDLSAEWP